MRRRSGSLRGFYQPSAASPRPDWAPTCLRAESRGLSDGYSSSSGGLRLRAPLARSLSKELKSSAGRLRVASDPLMWRANPRRACGELGVRAVLSPAPPYTALLPRSPPPSACPRSPPPAHTYTHIIKISCALFTLCSAPCKVNKCEP